MKLVICAFILLTTFAQGARHVKKHEGKHSQKDGASGFADKTGADQELGARGFADKTTGDQASSLRKGRSGKGEYRFRKRNFTTVLPEDISYPATAQSSRSLQGTKAVSVRWFGHFQVTESLKPALGEHAGFDAWPLLDQGLFAPGPFHHGHVDDEEPTKRARLWHEFKEVAECQKMRMRGVKTKEIMTVHPLFNAEDSIQDSANRVQADFPTQFPTQMLETWMGSKAGLTLDANIFHRPECGGGVEFVNGAVALGGLVGWAVSTVSPVAFATKWQVGRARPEEMAFNIRNGELKASKAVTKLVKSVKFNDAAGFTAYSEGSPLHPSYPAMHSAASSMSAWVDIVGNLTDQQRGEGRLLDFSVAYYRTLAGVHFPSDNRAGLALGQYLVQRHLPGHLARLYACDAASAKAIEEYVTAKIERLNSEVPLDWATWRPEKFVFTEFDDEFGVR